MRGRKSGILGVSGVKRGEKVWDPGSISKAESPGISDYLGGIRIQEPRNVAATICEPLVPILETRAVTCREDIGDNAERRAPEAGPASARPGVGIAPAKANRVQRTPLRLARTDFKPEHTQRRPWDGGHPTRRTHD